MPGGTCTVHFCWPREEDGGEGAERSLLHPRASSQPAWTWADIVLFSQESQACEGHTSSRCGVEFCLIPWVFLPVQTQCPLLGALHSVNTGRITSDSGSENRSQRRQAWCRCQRRSLGILFKAFLWDVVDWIMSSNQYVEILTPGPCESDCIWKQGLFRCN